MPSQKLHLRRTLAVAGVLALVALLLLRGMPAPPAARAQSSGSGPPYSACALRIAERAPGAMRVCDEAAVTVTMQVTRPKALPLHVVFTVAKHLLMFDHLDEAKAVARDAAGALEFTEKTLAGVVSLSVQSKTELELTNKQSAVLSAINSIKLDQLQPTARYYDWLSDAEDLLARARSEALSPVEIIVLISTGCPIGYESYCQRQEASANRIKGKGITIIGVCNPNASVPPPALPSNHCNAIRAMSSPGSYFDLRQGSRVEQRLVELEAQGKEVQPEAIRLLERLAPGFSYVAGSAAGYPAERLTKMERNADRMLWEWKDVPADGFVTATYRVKPSAEGLHALRLDTSEAFVEDNLGRVSPSMPLPPRDILVGPCLPPTPAASPTPTASPSPTLAPSPTDTATAAASATPSATVLPSHTPVPPRRLVYLPLTLVRGCRPAERYTDVVLAMDASSSMGQSSGGTTRLAAAQAAARRFLSLLDLAEGRDQAALVTFSGEARILAGLSRRGSELGDAVESIALGRGTRIDLGLQAAVDLLTGPDRRPANKPVIVLLSDGQPDEGTADAALVAAARAQGLGAEVYMIGFGDEAGAELLRRLASRPENFLAAPGPAELSAVYERVAGDLPCPGGQIWSP